MKDYNTLFTKDFFFFSFLILVCFLPYFGYSAALVIIFCSVFLWDKFSIVPLTSLLLIRTLSPGITEISDINSILNWGLLLFCLLRFFFYSVFVIPLKWSQLLKLNLFFCVVALFSSYIGTDFFYISVLKLFTYFLMSHFILFYFKNGIVDLNRSKVTLISFLNVILISSFIVKGIPAISFARDGVGFQGILNHPQGLGIIIGSYCGLLCNKLLTDKDFRWYDFFLFILSLTAVYLSGARTGVISIFVAYLIAVLFRFIFNVNISNRLVRRSILFGAPVVLLLSFFGSTVVKDYFLKNSESEDVSGALLVSRGFLIEESMENIRNNFYFGIGFGIAKSPSKGFSPIKTGGFIMSAPTEKPNLLLAVLEEVGIFSFLLFLIFTIYLIKDMLSNPNENFFAFGGLTAISTNISEMTFFSMGALGLFVWLMIAPALKMENSA